MYTLVSYFSTAPAIPTSLSYVTSLAPVGFWCWCSFTQEWQQYVVERTGLPCHAKEYGLYQVPSNKEQSQNLKQRLEQIGILERFFQAAGGRDRHQLHEKAVDIVEMGSREGLNNLKGRGIGDRELTRQRWMEMSFVCLCVILNFNVEPRAIIIF